MFQHITSSESFLKIFIGRASLTYCDGLAAWILFFFFFVWLVWFGLVFKLKILKNIQENLLAVYPEEKASGLARKASIVRWQRAIPSNRLAFNGTWHRLWNNGFCSGKFVTFDFGGEIPHYYLALLFLLLQSFLCYSMQILHFDSPDKQKPDVHTQKKNPWTPV